MEDTFNPSFRKTFRRYSRDAKNLFLYGEKAPLTHQLIFIEPSSIRFAIEKPIGEPWLFKRKHSALVIDGDWDLKIMELDSHPKIHACNKHFISGFSWEHSGMFDLMIELIEKFNGFDGCYNLEDIQKRYAKIEQLYDKIKVDGQLQPRKSFIANNHREFDGILIHINRNGEPIFHGSGCHRLSIARALKLEKIPCELGVVHKNALKTPNYHQLIQSTYM